MFTSLAEAWDAEVTRDEAKAEIKKSFPDDVIWDTAPDGSAVKTSAWQTFLSEVGDKPFYEGGEVLGWLGY